MSSYGCHFSFSLRERTGHLFVSICLGPIRQFFSMPDLLCPKLSGMRAVDEHVLLQPVVELDLAAGEERPSHERHTTPVSHSKARQCTSCRLLVYEEKKRPAIELRAVPILSDDQASGDDNPPCDGQ